MKPSNQALAIAADSIRFRIAAHGTGFESEPDPHHPWCQALAEIEQSVEYSSQARRDRFGMILALLLATIPALAIWSTTFVSGWLVIPLAAVAIVGLMFSAYGFMVSAVKVPRDNRGNPLGVER